MWKHWDYPESFGIFLLKDLQKIYILKYFQESMKCHITSHQFIDIVTHVKNMAH